MQGFKDKSAVRQGGGCEAVVAGRHRLIESQLENILALLFEGGQSVTAVGHGGGAEALVAEHPRVHFCLMFV